MATGNYFLIIHFSDVTEWSEQISWVCEADDDPYLLCDSISEDDVISFIIHLKCRKTYELTWLTDYWLIIG